MSNYKVEYVPGYENSCWNKAINFINTRSSVLDVGCSNGGFGDALKKYKNCSVDGVEPDAGDARMATKKIDNVINKDIESSIATLRKEGGRYDYVTFMDVIEHLQNPSEVLRNISSILEKSGSVIFSIPNMAHASTRLMLLEGEFEYGDTGLLDDTHLHFYTKKEITRVFSEAGFEIVKWDYTLAEFTPRMVNAKLQKIGLNASKKGAELFQDESAQIFQYVGLARLSSENTGHKKPKYSPDPQGDLSEYYEEMLRNSTREIKVLKKQQKLLESEIDAIKSTKSYKITRSLNSALRRK